MPSLPPLASLLDPLPVPMIAAGLDGRVQHLNPAAADALGVSPFDVLGEPLTDVLGIDPGPEPAIVPASRRPLTAHARTLPRPRQGRLIVLGAPLAGGTAAGQDPRLGPLLEQLTLTAEAVPTGHRIVDRALFAALLLARRMAQRAEDEQLDGLLAAGVPPHGDVDAAEVLRDVLLELAPWIRLSGATVTCTPVVPRHVPGSPGLLARLLEELLLNALAHTGRDGAIALSLTERDATLVVEIADDGPGPGDADLATLTGDGVRGPRAERVLPGGSGSGLHRVAAIARVTGARLELGAAPGGGFVARVHLPHRAPAPAQGVTA